MFDPITVPFEQTYGGEKGGFEEHEKSHADEAFASKFGALAEMCSDSRELGYEMLWQGAPEGK